MNFGTAIRLTCDNGIAYDSQCNDAESLQVSDWVPPLSCGECLSSLQKKTFKLINLLPKGGVNAIPGGN